MTDQPAAVDASPPQPAPQPSLLRRWLEVLAAFSKLGLISFGGPVAHLGYLRDECVTRRKWLDDAAYADLVALCQFLPGPASSQVVFGLGMKRAGLLGALTASFCFTAPSAALMIAFAYGVASVGDLSQAGWLRGLKIAAVAVVAQAVWGMAQKLCPDNARRLIGLLAAALVIAVVYLFSSYAAYTQVGAIVVGGLIGWLVYRRAPLPVVSIQPDRGSSLKGGLVLGVFGALLIALPLLAAAWPHRPLAEIDAFYRAGSLVFGGGHVVLPLLAAEVVPRWVSNESFIAGYGAAQAVPGPLFTFSAYLGAAMDPGPRAWLMGVICLIAIFVPAWLLVGGALPFWHRLRARTWAQAALRGANASVVGILLAALWHPVITEGVKGWLDGVLAAAAFAALTFLKAPSWLIVGLLAAICAFLPR